MTFEQLKEKIGTADPADWHQHKNGGGWIHASARVDESAIVGKDAIVWGIVSGDARVSGNAQVSGDAWVYGNARVSGDAWESSPLFIIGSRFSLTNSKKGHLQIGCRCETFAWWQKNGEALAKENDFTKSEIEEYREYLKLFIKLGK